jgi:hypothetical protein
MHNVTLPDNPDMLCLTPVLDLSRVCKTVDSILVTLKARVKPIC